MGVMAAQRRWGIAGSTGVRRVAVPVALTLLLAWPAAVRADPGARPDTSHLSLRVGPAWQAHSDLLASPFRQRGSGLDAGLEYRRGGWIFELDGGWASASSGRNPHPPPDEDVWSGGVGIRRLWPVARPAGATLRVGAAASAVASVRRHAYLDGGTEYFADMIVPLSLAAAVRKDVGERTGIEEALDVAVASVLFRSPFAGTKESPTGSLAAPWEANLVRHRFRLSHRSGPGLVWSISHGLTFLTSSRYRDLRIVRQDVSASLGLMLGAGR